MTIRKSRMKYRPLVVRDDADLAQAFDEWVYRQPEPVRVQALLHVHNVIQSADKMGETTAKALVFMVYAEVLMMERM